MSTMTDTARLWWPADWADEIMPPGRARPDDFIIDANGHDWLGYAFDATDASAQDKRYFSRPLQQDEIVNFLCCDDLGAVDITIESDGGYAVHGDVPPRATHFWVAGNFDMLGNSVAEFAKNIADNACVTFPLRVTMSMSWWSDSLPHKLVHRYEADRVAACFEPVSSAEAHQ